VILIPVGANRVLTRSQVPRRIWLCVAVMIGDDSPPGFARDLLELLANKKAPDDAGALRLVRRL
jgi:hypothetical protein